MKIIYHSRDLDGYCSGAILKKKFPHAQLIGYDYGQPIPLIGDGEEVIMVDVSFKVHELMTIAARCKSFVWIDHHISAIKEFRDLNATLPQLRTVLQDGIAACEIAWNWAYPNDDMPIAVKLLGMYDTWRNSDINYWNNYILPFQYGMRAISHSAESFPPAMLMPSDLEDIEDAVSMGRVILDYQRSQDAISAKNCFEFTWQGYHVLALNRGGVNSLTFESRFDSRKHDLMMPYFYNGKKWVFSLYTTSPDIDCSLLAKMMGGGGHRKAAGFEVDSLSQMGFA